jgi:hypothetical protein
MKKSPFLKMGRQSKSLTIGFKLVDLRRLGMVELATLVTLIVYAKVMSRKFAKN